MQHNHFCYGYMLCHANSQKPASGDREIIGDTYIAQVVLTNARLGFGGTVPIFIGGNKLQFWGKFLTRFSIGGLLKMGNRKQ